MKHYVKFLLLIFFCFHCFILSAQQKHFLYVQSEDKQPFAIILSGKVYSSSDYGYIIIPKLTDGDYKFTVSFPMNKFPEQSFACTVNKKDAGYLLKNNNNAWVLENMQTKQPVVSANTATASTNAFGSMLADVVDDSDLNKKNSTELPATNNAAAVVAATAGAVVVSENITPPVNQPQKISEIKADTGTSMLFVDKTETGIDTIGIFVAAENTTTNMGSEKNASPDPGIQQPSDNAAVIAVPVIAGSSQTNMVNDTATVAATAETMPDTATNEISNPFYKPEQSGNASVVENNASAVAAGTVAGATAVAASAIKQDCASTISDDDLNKLKRKMFTHHSDNEMIQSAIKSLGKKCITTEQVKILGGLFASDDGRYNLYDALYKSVYDYGNYSALANQIVDPYYKKRFAAMLR